MVVMVSLLAGACGTSNSMATSEAEGERAASVRADLEGYDWLVESLDRGFNTTAAVGVGTVRFFPPDDYSPAPSVGFINSCGGSSGSYIEFSDTGFTQIDTPAGVNVEIAAQGPGCPQGEPDDFTFPISERGLTMSVTVDGDIATFSHEDFAFTAVRQGPIPQTPTTEDTATTLSPPTTAP